MKEGGLLLLALAGLVGAPAPALAVEVEVLTLETARALALSSRAELRAGAAGVRAARADIDVVGAGEAPQLGARAEVTAAPGGQLVEIPGTDALVQGSPPIEAGASAFTPVLRYGVSLGLDWTVLDFGRTAALRRAAEAEAGAREADLAATRAELVAAVDAAYLAWLGAEARLDLARGGAARARARVERLRARAEGGLADADRLLPARYAAAAAELREANADHAAARARLALGGAIGRRLAEGLRPDRALLEAAPAPPPDGGSEQALEARLAAARARATALDRAGRPTLGLTAQAGLRGQEDRLFPVYAGGLGLTLPLLDGGRRDARARAARQEAEALAARLQAEAARSDRAEDRRVLDLAAAERRVGLAASLLELAGEARREVESRLEEGVASPEQLTAADERVDQAEVVLLDARLERARLRLGLEAS